MIFQLNNTIDKAIAVRQLFVNLHHRLLHYMFNEATNTQDVIFQKNKDSEEIYINIDINSICPKCPFRGKRNIP